MELDNNEPLPDSQTFKDFRDPGTPEVWRPNEDLEILRTLEHDAHFSDPTCRNIRKVRKPVYIKSRSRMKKMSYDHLTPFVCKTKLILPDCDVPHISQQRTTFGKREITTIQEEMTYYKKRIKPKASFKGKACKEKVASLKVVIGRLNEMCLAKPEVLQNKVPEEVMKLFSGIQL